MEENNQNEVEQQVDIVVEQQSAPTPTVVEDTPKTEVEKSPRRKNGRNSRSSSQSQKKSTQSTQTCGEISDISAVSERLSGSNVNGYPETKKSKDTEPKTVEKDAEEVEEKAEAKLEEQPECKCEDENKHEGPAFEQKKFTPRAIEVTLQDRRPKNSEADKKQDGVVSYSAADEATCPPVSLLAKIKAALKSIFGLKKDKKNDKKKKFDKNFKKDFKGKKNFHNKKFNKDGKYNNRRHQNRGKRPHNNAPKEQ